MSIDAAEYARLSSDSYKDRSKWVDSKKGFSLEGSDVEYTVLAVYDDPKTDYQGTAYQRVDTKEVIIAHRGTASAKDGRTDAGMVFNGHNDQLDHAVAFTDRAIAIAQERAKDEGYALNVSITGHSLGGTLAEITAARTGLHAETFNSYGPAALIGLDRYGVDVKAPHPNIVNHVRAIDVVGAADPHLGSVRTYAAPEDIESLKRGRYIGSLPLPVNPVLAIDASAHTISNFLPNNKVIGDSALSPSNEARARVHAAAISHYRDDVMRGRGDFNKIATNAASVGTALNVVRLGTQVTEAAAMAVATKPPQMVYSGAQAAGSAMITGAQRAGQALDQAGASIREGASRLGDKLSRPGSWSISEADPAPSSFITDPGHPGRSMFAQAQGHLQRINGEYGIPCNQQTDNAAACVAAASKQAGLTRIDQLALNDNGDKMIAVQGTPGNAFSKVVAVDTVQALNTPIAQSSQAFAVADAQATQQDLQRSQQVAQVAQSQAAPAMS
ncbi:MAG: DUF2974 domain-containing protein [Variovorax sp.]|nr:MAG: DUF2974 domain-containing protein [Variovorax sp.]